MDIEKRITAVETEMKRWGVTVPGTTISRVLLDTTLCQKEGVQLPDNDEAKEAYLVWSVGLGMMSYPKKFFHGMTISDALDQAESWSGQKMKEYEEFVSATNY